MQNGLPCIVVLLQRAWKKTGSFVKNQRHFYYVCTASLEVYKTNFVLLLMFPALLYSK